MKEAFSILFLSYVAFTNLIHGLIGGIVSAQFGWYWKNDKIRWSLCYALIGIFCAYVFTRYGGSTHLRVYSQLDLFIPMFAAIGLGWSWLFKYKIEDVDWRILVLFPVVGIIAAVFYQVRGQVMLFAALGMIAGGIIWYLIPSRLYSTIILGTILALTLLPDGVSRSQDILEAALGGLLGGFFGWFIRNQTARWTLALAMSGTLAGSVVYYTVFGNYFLPILIGIIIGGLVGFFVQAHERRKMLTFILLGAVFFCGVKMGWDTILILEWRWNF